MKRTLTGPLGMKDEIRAAIRKMNDQAKQQAQTVYQKNFVKHLRSMELIR